MIPSTAQEIFDTVVREQRIPWIPEHMDDEAYNVTWSQLVRENRVPATFDELINGLHNLISSRAPVTEFIAYAVNHNLDPSVCELMPRDLPGGPVSCAFEFQCARCNYRSELLYIGRGMDSTFESVVGTCTACNRLTTVTEEQVAGDCCLCTRKARVVFTPHFVRPNPNYASYGERIVQYQCPVCHEFTVERLLGSKVLWD